MRRLDFRRALRSIASNDPTLVDPTTSHDARNISSCQCPMFPTFAHCASWTRSRIVQSNMMPTRILGYKLSISSLGASGQVGNRVVQLPSVYERGSSTDVPLVPPPEKSGVSTTPIRSLCPVHLTGRDVGVVDSNLCKETVSPEKSRDPHMSGVCKHEMGEDRSNCGAPITCWRASCHGGTCTAHVLYNTVNKH
jgi:hypothetical protein